MTMRHLFWIASVGVLLASPVHAQRPQADYSNNNTRLAWADVLQVEPVYETVRVPVPQQQCQDYYYGERRDGGGGAVLGAIVGGMLGNTVGKGDGRKAATVAGAVAGGVVGNNVARGRHEPRPPQRYCEQINDYQEERRMSGYDVQYRYRGDAFMARMGYDPGDRVRVRVSVSPVD